jgi:hypothetical protein
MKADEIRCYREQLRVLSVEEQPLAIMQMVTEIAAQLAELNETLSVFANVKASFDGGIIVAEAQR